MSGLGRLWPVVAVAMLLPGPARADGGATGAPGDPRIVTVEAAPGEVIALDATPGHEVFVLMPAGEHIRQTLVADTAGWHVSLTAARDGMTLYALHPVSGTSLAVIGEQRSYDFKLTASADTAAPFVMRIVNRVHSDKPDPATQPVPVPTGVYRVSGDKHLLPDSMSDDGQKVYIVWAENQPIPAVFSVDAQGHEEMTDGYMRNGRFTLDRLYEHLVFRIDKAEASAIREIPKAKRK